jgi:hypothetical protein
MGPPNKSGDDTGGASTLPLKPLLPPPCGEGGHAEGLVGWGAAPALYDLHPTRPLRDTLPIEGREGRLCSTFEPDSCPSPHVGRVGEASASVGWGAAPALYDPHPTRPVPGHPPHQGEGRAFVFERDDRARRLITPPGIKNGGISVAQSAGCVKKIPKYSSALPIFYPNQSDRGGHGVVFGHGRNEPENKCPHGVCRGLGRSV